MTLKNKYNELMDNIKVTGEMHDRIIENIEGADFNTERNKNNSDRYIKKYLYVAACFVFLIASIAVIPYIIKLNNNPPAQVIPDIMEYNSIEELSEAVGFIVPEINKIPFEVKKVTYTAYWKELAEVIYSNQEESIILRKSFGSEDNSGDYNEYSTVKEELAYGHIITIKGNAGVCNLAIWEKDGYIYSLRLLKGVSETEILKMVISTL